jgi:hypothetical protein
MSGNRYSQEEDDLIRSLYMTNSLKEIGRKIGRSGNCVSERLERLGIRGAKRVEMRKNKPLHNYGAYKSWSNMITRCENSNRVTWGRYGGRGITVCRRWRSSFLKFLEDMGERPSGYSIDRINPNGNYEPGNCRWIPRREEASTQERVVFQKPCIACGSTKANRAGRCHRCNEYFRRNGVDRPNVTGRVPIKIKPLKRCRNCNTPAKPITNGRCGACSITYRTTGKERDQKFWHKKSPIIEKKISVPFDKYIESLTPEQRRLLG